MVQLCSPSLEYYVVVWWTELALTEVMPVTDLRPKAHCGSLARDVNERALRNLDTIIVRPKVCPRQGMFLEEVV